MTSILELKDISLDYPDGLDDQGQPRTVRALDRVSLTLKAGDFKALTGSSGSGKSSLLSVAAGLIQPSSGQRLIQGQDTSSYSEAQLARLRREKIGLIFQQPNLIPSLTALEQLEVMARISGLGGAQLKEARSRAADLLDLVGLKDQASVSGSILPGP